MRNPEIIRRCLIDLARENLGYAVTLKISSAIRRKIGNVDLMLSNCHILAQDELKSAFIEKAAREADRIGQSLGPGDIVTLVDETYSSLVDSLSNGDEWKIHIPAKTILAKFAAKALISLPRLKRAYIAAAERAEANPFQQIIDIFQDFARY